MAWRYSNANGTPIRDFGVGSFAIRRDAVPTILGVGRPPTGEGSPLGREALASLAIAASLARLTIHEAPVYAYERDTRPIDMEFLDHVGPTPSRLGAPTSTWHRAQSPQPQQEAVKVEVRVAQYQSAEV